MTQTRVVEGNRQPKNKNKERAQGRQTRRLMLMPQKQIQQPPVFDIAEDPKHSPRLQPKYDWHMVMNHASPDVLTRLARNPYINEPYLKEITSTNELACKACLQGKPARSGHRRKTQNYALGEAFSTDIMGPLQPPAIPAEVERYFI